MSAQLAQWLNAIKLYTHQYPSALLWIWGLLLLVVVLRYVVQYLYPDKIHWEFRKAGIHPSEQQEEALREDFGRIAAEGARKRLEEQLKHQAATLHDQAQLTRVTQIARAHVAAIREVGETLQAVEREYMKYRQSLASEQAKEALRLIVEKSVAQITEMTAASSTTLPQFIVDEAKTNPKRKSNPEVGRNGNSVKLNGNQEWLNRNAGG
jgi:hypothetical protein